MSVAPPLTPLPTNGTAPRPTPPSAPSLTTFTAPDEPRPVLARPDSVRPPAAVAPAAAGYGLFAPVLLLALAVVGWSGFQTYQLTREHQQLAVAREVQQTQVEAAARIRANLDALAASTQRLANAGNANARTIVEALRSRGVNINPNPTTAATTPPAR